MIEQRSLADTYIPDMNFSPTKGKEILREWRRKKKVTSTSVAIRPGNTVYVKMYEATTVPQWDSNPILLIIEVSKSYVLGFNINWLNTRERRLLLNNFEKYKIHKRSRLQRQAIFKTLKRQRFTRSAYRVYFKSEFTKTRLYKLTTGELFIACTNRMLNQIKI